MCTFPLWMKLGAVLGIMGGTAFILSLLFVVWALVKMGRNL